MKLLRKHIAPILKLALGSFSFSWVLLVLAVPFQVATLGESHQLFFIYNSDEGCYELVMDHHKDLDPNHIAEDQENEYHSIHSSCCYDGFLVKTKKVVDQQTTNFSAPQLLFTTTLYSENNSDLLLERDLPPPKTSLNVIRVTRLLI
tara:strand:+ start:12651 stop:13091 length:441 start_codon:yes stop_codon:yes gene_type:complete